MSISYSIATASPLEASMVAASLAGLPGFLKTEDGISSPGLQISIREPSALQSSVIEDAFGFRPRLYIGFRPDKFADGRMIVDRILRAAAELLCQTVDDISLLLNGEDVILTRIQGHLLLYERAEFWTEARVKMFPEQHSFMAPRLL